MRSAPVLAARHRERVLRAVGEGADLEEREEAIALEDLVPVDLRALEVVRSGVVRLLPARAEQLVDDAAGLLELAVGEDALLADLETAGPARESRRAVDVLQRRSRTRPPRRSNPQPHAGELQERARRPFLDGYVILMARDASVLTFEKVLETRLLPQARACASGSVAPVPPSRPSPC